MDNGSIVLRACDYSDDLHWRWVLRAPDGALLADHVVALERNLYEALLDVPSYLRRNAAPDNRESEERRLLFELGGLIGVHVLGEAIMASMLERTPLTVQVVLPAIAAHLVDIPLNLAHLRERNADYLPLREVSLVFEIDGDVVHQRAKSIGKRLRILAV